MASHVTESLYQTADGSHNMGCGQSKKSFGWFHTRDGRWTLSQLYPWRARERMSYTTHTSDSTPGGQSA